MAEDWLRGHEWANVLSSGASADLNACALALLAFKRQHPHVTFQAIDRQLQKAASRLRLMAERPGHSRWFPPTARSFYMDNAPATYLPGMTTRTPRSAAAADFDPECGDEDANFTRLEYAGFTVAEPDNLGQFVEDIAAWKAQKGDERHTSLQLTRDEDLRRVWQHFCTD